MSKKVTAALIFLVFSVLSFGEFSKTADGVLVADSFEEWVNFFGDDPSSGNTVCSLIGSTLMEISYSNEGKKLQNKNDTAEILNYINENLSAAGITNPVKGKGYLYEIYFAKNCRKFTEKDYNLIGSPTFKKTMEKIFSTYR